MQQQMQATQTLRSFGPQDFMEWDVTNWSVALDFWSARTQQDLSRCSVLELGGRHGGLSLWLATRGARVVCSDVGGPSAQAVAKHRAAGYGDRIVHATVDATAIPYEGQFDVIVFKSVLGAVGLHKGTAAMPDAIGQMHKALKPGGELFFAENLAGSALHQELRKRFVKWGQKWHYPTIDAMTSYLAPFASVTYETVGFAGTLGRSTFQRDALGTLDRMGLDRLVPQSWRYIMVGVARKAEA